MNIVIINTVTISIIVIRGRRTNLVVKDPSGRIVSLDGRLHEQGTTQHVSDIAIQALDILTGIGE